MMRKSVESTDFSTFHTSHKICTYTIAMKKAILVALTLCLLVATSVAQKSVPKKAGGKVAPKKPPPPKAKSYDGQLVFRTYVTATGHKTEM